jgi:hypothetical protein
MGAQNLGRLLMAKDLFPASGAAFHVKGKGYLLGWGDTVSTETIFATGAIFIHTDGAADSQVYINEGSGEGSATSWEAVGDTA